MTTEREAISGDLAAEQIRAVVNKAIGLEEGGFFQWIRINCAGGTIKQVPVNDDFRAKIADALLPLLSTIAQQALEQGERQERAKWQLAAEAQERGEYETAIRTESTPQAGRE